MNPKAKSSLLVEKLEEETLVYDLERHRAHCLNPLAAFLLRKADGDQTLEELVDLTREALDPSVTEGVVRLGLDRLRKARILDWDGPELGEGEMGRREAIRRLAGVGIVLPSVLTVAAAQGPPGTKITPAACRKEAINLGKCCTNSRACIQVGARRRCSGPPC